MDDIRLGVIVGVFVEWGGISLFGLVEYEDVRFDFGFEVKKFEMLFVVYLNVGGMMFVIMVDIFI